MADYAGNYAGNVAAIYRDLGRSQAEAKLRKGAAWGQAISDIGQTVAGIPGQLRAEKRQAQEDQLWEANFADFQQKRKENQAIKDAINSSVGQDGQIDEQRLAQKFQLMGMSDLTERALQPIRESKAAAMNLRHLEAQGVVDQAQLGELRKAAIAPFASAIVESNGNPAVLEGALAAIRITTPELADAIEHDLSQAKPEDVKRFAQSLIAPAKDKAPLVTKPGDIGRDPVTGAVLFQNEAAPDEPKSLDAMLAAALKARDRAKVNEIIKLKAQEANATRAPQQPKDERIVQIMGPSGTPVWVRESEAVGKPAAQAARAVTGSERQALAFFNRAKNAAEDIEPLEEQVASMGLMGQAAMNTLPNFMQSQVGQQYRQAQRAFTEARLRKESGAAINKDEYDKDARTYFAQPGDSKETAAQKKKAREKVLEGLAYAAGKAYDEFYGQSFREGMKPAEAANAGGLVPATTPPPDQSGNWKWNGQQWVKRQ